MSGLVGIIANDAARYSLFTASAIRLRRDHDTRVEVLIGGDWCSARNDLVRMALADPDCEWLWFMDDDHAFPPNLLDRLLSHGDLDIVQPVCLTRRPPFHAVQFPAKKGYNKYAPIAFRDAPTDGLVELEAGGCAGMLIRRRVLEALEEPWFEYLDRSEDIVFCESAKKAGFRLWCDLGAKLGHITTATIWPATLDRNEGRPEDGQRWAVGFAIGQEYNVFIDVQEEEA